MGRVKSVWHNLLFALLETAIGIKIAGRVHMTKREECLLKSSLFQYLLLVHVQKT